MLELSKIAERYGTRPSTLWGFVDRGLALDFDRLHNIRAGFHEVEKAQREAELMRGDGELADQRKIFTSGEGVKFS